MKQRVHDKGAPVVRELLDPSFVVLRLRPALELSPNQLLEISGLNRDLRLELTAEGELVVMTPTGGESSEQNGELTFQLVGWTKRSGAGRAFESSGGFVLPNGAIRSPDASWVANSRLQALNPEQRKKYLPLCPDFVVELRSPSDRLSVVQEKMQEYVENGARLGLLLDPTLKRVHVYRPDELVRILENPEAVSGEPVLPGFVLDLREVW